MRDSRTNYGVVVHLCFSESLWGVERYIQKAITAQINSGITSIPVGNFLLEKEFNVASPLLKFGTVGRILFLIKLRPVVIHAHMTRAEFWGFVISRITGSKLVSTRHFAKTRGRNSIVRIFSRYFNKVCSEQIAVSRYVKDNIEFHDSHVIYPGVTSSPVTYSIKSKKALLLQRLSPEKETDLGLKIWAQSSLPNRGWKLEIYGDGPCSTSLMRLADELNISDSVVFWGKTNNPLDVLLDCDVLLTTCRIETFGFSIVEAMSVGVPVLAPFSPSSLELIGPLRNYCIYDAENIDDGAAKLDVLGENESLRLDIGSRLRNRQQDLFNIRNFEELERFYFSA